MKKKFAAELQVEVLSLKPRLLRVCRMSENREATSTIIRERKLVGLESAVARNSETMMTPSGSEPVQF